ncbi:beta-aspartyl-peptidase [Clostridium sp. 'White wine YQ']|uniref:beta-aspartyl-peptidase n=1 Tax=Clostridium sp. 'White wine YQ' TaxID=3027474 RepID=UPI0023662205|nr:beta-aspartyl-peptidase [Clostridium sp. 'White wine YQ']MDD7795955.1 beta-aspartyl-peptidase [Clostridium sp. 'White wine YQ']
MITIIKNAEIYAPEYIGKKILMLTNDKIEGIYDEIDIPDKFLDINVVDGTNMIVIPGFIDSHVHIMGAGGEGGFRTRTPEIPLSEFVKSGTTTVVGCIGTDGICRDMRGLIAKCYALEEEGITTYCYTGSYEIPVRTLTESVKGDIMLLHKVIGVGEIALSDNRSSQPTYEEFLNVVAEARVGGLLSGKAGIVNVHLGDGARMMEYLFRLVEGSEIPATQLLPTHVNRNEKLFLKAIEYASKGGYVDLTTASDPNFLEDTEVKASSGLKRMLESGVPENKITFSSDGNGSMPRFNEKREMIGLGICSLSSLYREFKDSVLKEGVPLEKALKVVTSNVAQVLKLSHKGRIESGKDADILLLDKENLNIVTMFAKGKKLKENGKILVKGTFEGF